MPLAIITGSARRIGKNLALNFARKGWDIIVHFNTSLNEAINVADQINAMGQRSVCIKADLRNPSEVSSLFHQAQNAIGIPDLLINNAGIFPDRKSINELFPEDWNNTIASNLSSQFYCSKAFSDLAGKNSRIINIASLGGIEVWKNRVPYNVSKAGVIQLTRVLASELGPYGIRVNCIAPSAIATERVLKLGREGGMISDSRMRECPLGRAGTPEDIAKVVEFLCTDLSDYVTGQCIRVDGGRTLF